ncbi:MAG TPA: Glu-tRNA(Gln) amidotransferase subunit GatE [Candidatus Pacearchaeota archaeon]|nr:Glu-tRNA(Gln) amidotransferase subunit GatE [Candidatus Pacearchaeota archaeon]HOR52202.1 Glu-tRNA(Gln) amidotransferase subunit GatE [Candidatus Pacearchaeota archaeon]HOU79464.1 Glu-tRNA(Gln) amidotransferase subunit GatE [Candidatus Pacearchaeota archaeon]HQF83115.1 Glu-tRNA(Gln) amidotransferase subunit GatE [Candidatus Pacearchaeota archaeon]HQI58017.1 Glu-tRNA(Gln) amidotransferase subunit GatE [Candidatus Pacearchaeota archaeon]
MSDIDYSKLKFKSGLEIHQQLDTHKLFCNCPSILRGDLPDFYVERKLHAVAGESGEVDRAAEYQASLKKTFVYQGYRNSTCLIELDEEPPHEINEDALKIALQIALLLNCKIIPVTQIMRKTVIDGSNTSGFQRTVLIARDGYVETDFGRVGIETICLEEDAARKVKVEGEKVYWNLDRLGIPLVEIATSPDIKSAEQAKEVAMYIGDVLRSCKVKRGIGTIRQDVNISILEGNRVEMKGVQDMRTFIKTIENEVLRQKELYDEGTPTQPEVRNALPDCSSEFLRPMPGADRMYPETDLPLLKLSRDFIDSLKKDLPKLRSESAGELRERGLSEEMVKLILGEDKIEELKSLAEIYSNLNFIAKMIVLFPKEIASKENKTLEEVEEQVMDYYGDILRLLNKKKIVEGDVKDILINLVKGMDFKEAIKIEKVDNSEIEEEILKIIKEKPGLNANAYMGLVMAKFKGKINGKQAMDVINKLMNKE